MGFRVNVVARIIIILLLGCGGIYLLANTAFWLLSMWMILGVVVTIISLIRYVERNQRDMTNFLLSIKQNDFTNSYPTNSFRSGNNWYKEFNAINDKFRELRSEKQSNYHFLQTIIEHTGVPLICFKTRNMEITLMNGAAKDLFQKPFFNTMKSLSLVDKSLPKLLLDLHSGQQKLRSIQIGNEVIPLSINAREVVLEEERFKLIAFHNIKNELEEKELESWQKLIKVLTHEIKNSAIPISTLTEVINQMIVDENGQLKDLNSFNEEEINDLKNGLRTVGKRSKGLVKFVNAFGRLSKLPKPKLVQLIVSDLFANIKSLFANELEKNNITLKLSVSDGLAIEADQEMVEQILINLVKNATEALYNTQKGTINLNAYPLNQGAIIEISDNGQGIDQGTFDNIFVPFFTTKKDGSGIGLSLSRQIMKSHGGSISVKSNVGSGTSFKLQFH